jgi:predicted  nucleic acid-binding Zn-ribbon protein
LAETIPGENNVLPQNQQSAADKIAALDKRIEATKKELVVLQEQMNPIVKAHRDASNLLYALEDERYALFQGQLFFEGGFRG